MTGPLGAAPVTADDFSSRMIGPQLRAADYTDLRLEAAMRALPEAQQQYTALPVRHGFQDPEDPVTGSVIPSDRFRAAVGAGAFAGHGDIPSLTRDLVAK
ncbi:hypothetical protein [Streptomyces griseiscabiei]|uniref:Uncharacterized protein n=1 Tax=Streptomyces griseiscabiei TaxID=2993540 RepID=A0ABU4L4C0_9ACTN|nr:hypothetical protein [Streptomyces griseiscabiei]MBZ3905480.1 hypothetical protein [Streptomyces griseiscabiei]MDX2910571.1 hypothetical protein [Streptomyces griseiscabiei]